MVPIWVALILTIILYFLYKFPYYKRRYEKLKAFPHPPEHFLLGHILEVNNPSDLARKLTEWTKTYGSIYRLSIGHIVAYITSDPGLLEFIITKTRYTIKGRVYESLYPWFGEGIVTADGELWRKKRNMITPTFHLKILEDFIEVFNKHTEILLQEIKMVDDGPSIDIFKYIPACTHNTICETAMGVSLNTEEEYRKAVENIQYFIVSNVSSLIKPSNFLFKFTRTYWNLRKNLKITHRFTDKVIRAKRKEKEERKMTSSLDIDKIGVKNRKIFLDLLLESEIDGRPWDDIEIREEVDTFMVAGQDTTATSICFTLYCLSLHADVQTKAFKEVNSILEGDKCKKVTYTHCQDMKYLDLVIKETMRIYPALPLIGREIVQDFEYGGYTFLKGSLIGLHIRGAHMDPKNFKDPEVFKPDRWLEDDYKIGNLFNYLPFSAGPRNCLGKKYALLEMKVVLAKILMNFEVIPPEKPNELKMAYQFTLKPVNGIRLRFKNRNI